MTKAESKYFHTAAKMGEAFLSILEEKDFAYITVKEICERAGVHRSTFYLHYETIDDLVSECVERINEEFFAYFRTASAAFPRDIGAAPLEQLFLITPEYLLPYLTYVAEHRAIFKIVLTQPETLQARKTYDALFSHVIRSILERHRVPEREQGYMMDFYIGGLMNIVRRWLLSDCRDPVEEIAGIMMKVVRR